MQLFDTAQRQLVPFVPTRKQVRMYVCGITPYDSAHLGHILTFFTYDLLQRRLEDLGKRVRLVRNITDVDDPIFKRAAETGECYADLAARETATFQEVMRTLNFRNPDAEPLASEYIGEMAAAVAELLAKSHAYRLENDVYFDVSASPSFGQFSRFPKKLQRAFMAARGGDIRRPGKRQPLDFLLWRGITDPHDPAAWDSPVGRGRPGWHIECSVMAAALLGTPIDIHGGGMDLIFPHHECEIAQSESLGQQPFVTHWLHVAPMMLYGEKMSKSLGNLIFARDLLAHGSPAALRLSMLNYHYRTGGEWRTELWHEAQDLLRQIEALLHTNRNGGRTGVLVDVREALDDDLDAPEVLCAIRRHVRANGSAADLRAALNLIGIELN